MADLEADQEKDDEYEYDFEQDLDVNLDWKIILKVNLEFSFYRQCFLDIIFLWMIIILYYQATKLNLYS